MISNMLRKNNILDQNNSHKRATIANVHASTPKKNTSAVRHYSLSLSTIDTASSSEDKRNIESQIQDLSKKDKGHIKKKKKEVTKRRLENSESKTETKQKRKKLVNKSLTEKQKENLKHKEKRKQNVKKKQNVKRKQMLEDTNNEWETQSEKSINEFSISLRESTLDNDECIKLFEDPCTPEKTRDIPSTYEESLHTHESPILNSFRKRSYLISKRKNIILEGTLLPMNLLSTEVRSPETIDKDETINHHKSDAKTHVPLREPEKDPKEKPENLIFPTQFPTTTNYLRRNQSIKTYPGKKSRHSALTSPRTPIELIDFMRKLPNIPKKTKSIPIPPGMICDSRRWNKTLQKWESYVENSSQNEFKNSERKTKTNNRNKRKIIRKKKDIYDAANETDIEFETGGQDSKRISFREFSHKQKKVKDISLSDTK